MTAASRSCSRREYSPKRRRQNCSHARTSSCREASTPLSSSPPLLPASLLRAGEDPSTADLGTGLLAAAVAGVLLRSEAACGCGGDRKGLGWLAEGRLQEAFSSTTVTVKACPRICKQDKCQTRSKACFSSRLCSQAENLTRAMVPELGMLGPFSWSSCQI